MARQTGFIGAWTASNGGPKPRETIETDEELASRTGQEKSRRPERSTGWALNEYKSRLLATKVLPLFRASHQLSPRACKRISETALPSAIQTRNGRIGDQPIFSSDSSVYAAPGTESGRGPRLDVICAVRLIHRWIDLRCVQRILVLFEVLHHGHDVVRPLMPHVGGYAFRQVGIVAAAILNRDGEGASVQRISD